MYIAQPWSRKDQRRLYLKKEDSAGKQLQLGFLDLVSMKLVCLPSDSGTMDDLGDALKAICDQALSSMGRDPVDEGDLLEALMGDSDDLISPPWEDLAARQPGASLIGQDSAPYRQGVLGEQRTAGVLASLHHSGYKILHSIPLSDSKDLDHLVIGPTGLFAINTKFSTYLIEEKGGVVYNDSRPKREWSSGITRDAQMVGEILSRSLRLDDPQNVTPLLCCWSTVGVTQQTDGLMVSGHNLVDYVLDQKATYSAEMVDALFSAARRSDTWQGWV